MGSPPPEDAPSLADQESEILAVSFEPSPTGASLCGFGFPSFSLSLNIPFPPFPPELPSFSFALSLNCDLENPLDAEISFGGGRLPLLGPDPDDEP